MFLIRFLRCVFVRCAPFVTMAASGLLLSACATMFADREQTINLNPSQQEGDGVQVVVSSSSGTQRVQLPATVNVRSGEDRVIIRLQDDRYELTEVNVGRSIRGVYWVNILNGWGFLIDYLTGAMWRYDDLVVVPTDPKS